MGKIEIARDAAPLECLIQDVSEVGAQLSVASVTGVPSEFRLHLAAHPVRDCFVRWRSQTRLGVEFLSPAAASLRW